MLLASMISGLANAQSVTWSGDVIPPPPSPPVSDWPVNLRLYIGHSGTGTLTIADGGSVSDTLGYIGYRPGSDGTVTVTGKGSTWIDISDVYVGHEGRGRLLIENGGHVNSGTGYVADFPGSTGSVLVSGASASWLNKYNLEIGVEGHGMLTVENAGAVASDYGYVGSFTGSVGVARVAGQGSRWRNTQDLSVGYSGTGLLSIANGGTVFGVSGYIGSFDDGIGTVLVTGTGSVWSNSGAVTIGVNGAGTLSLSERGVTSTDTVFVGSQGAATGTLNLGATANSPAAVAGTLQAARLVFGDGSGSVNFNHTDSAYRFTAAIHSEGSGLHALNHFAGTTVLAADSATFSGTTTVSGGRLQVANQLGGSATVNSGRLQVDGRFAGPVGVSQNGTLAGAGSITGAASFGNGGMLEGIQGQTLTFGSDLTLDRATLINVTLGGADTPPLFDVGGALTLDGTLNVNSQGGFGQGIYRLFEHAGALTDNTLDIGTTPSSVSATDLFLQTGSGQVNLVYTAGATLNFWDGGNNALHNNNVVDGGDGLWSVADSNWTTVDGAINGPFLPNPNFAVFQGNGGRVTVDNTSGQIGITGLQIATDGYSIVGGELALQGGAESIIRVGDSSAARTGMVGTIASRLSGAGKLVKTDFGTLLLSGDNRYSGGTEVRGGVLAVNEDTNLGAASGTLTLNGGGLATLSSFDTTRAITLAQTGGFHVADGSTLGLDGPISGAGDLAKLGSGTLRLGGSNQYANTRVEAGTLIGDASAIRGSLLNNGVVVFEQNSDGSYSGALSGGGRLIKRGSGALTLGNSSDQDWHIESGRLLSTAERFTGDALIDAAGTLQFEQGSDAAHAGLFSGDGSFVKTGAGQLGLSGNSSAFTGQTRIQAGTLALAGDGWLGGTVTIASGATLQGTGTLGNTIVQSGAVVSPGNSLGTLRIAGDLTFLPGATYRVEADPGSSQSDRIAVTGTATLAGAVLHVGPEGNFASNRAYTILTAGTLQGQFDTLSSNFAFLDPSLRYRAQEVLLQLDRKQEGGSFVDAAHTDNQRAAAGALDSLPADNALHDYILTLPDGAPPGVFDSLSGELHASLVAGLLGAGSRLRAVPLSHLHGHLIDAEAVAGTTPIWTELSGNWQALRGDGNAATFDQRRHGLLLGTDLAINRGWHLGAALGYSGSDIAINHRQSEAELRNYSAALFGGKSFPAGSGALNLLGGASYSRHDIDTRRHTVVADVPQRLTADSDGNSSQLFVELGYALPLAGGGYLEPFAGLAWNQVRTDGFTETGGSAALHGRSSDEEQTSSTLGLRGHTGLQWGATRGQLRASLGWQHVFQEVTARRTLAFDDSQPFTVAGVPLARDAAVLELGVDLQIARTTTLGLEYRGAFGDGNREHQGVLNLQWRY